MQRRLSTSSTLLLASVLLAACSSELDDKARAKVEDTPAATGDAAAAMVLASEARALSGAIESFVGL